MKVDNVQGDVTAKGYENQISLVNCRFNGVSLPAKNETGRQYNKAIGSPKFGSLVLTKAYDSSSYALFQQICGGKPFSNIQITFTSTGDSLNAYKTIKITNAYVTGYHTDDNEDGSSVETIIIGSYDTISQTFTKRGADNKPASQVATGYNLASAQAM
jgi:type VI protein secretion system component Hcp